jgi:transketolase
MNVASEAMTTISPPLDERSRHLRRLVVRMLRAARRGHVGSAFSCIDILRVLYDDILRFDAADPKWPGRDRCILSKGHGCLALYALLCDKSFFPQGELDRFCAANGILGGHPDANKVPGVEASTGALGHGLSIGLGMALHLRMARSLSRVFVILGDGECNEGSVWEAAMCTGKHRLANLTAIVDYNKHQAYGTTREVQNLEPLADKWRAFGFAVREIDGHDIDAIRKVLQIIPFDPVKPSAIIAHTIKGRGASFAENNIKWHHKNKVTDDELAALDAELGGKHA